jgi:hypothetical protein
MESATRGNAAEAAVLAGLVKRGYEVLVPFGGGHPYDLAVDLGTAGVLRVQCKRAWPVNGCLNFNCRSTDHGRGRRPYFGRADVFGVYFPPNDSVYLVPLDRVAGFNGRLRLEPTRNNQRRGITMAADFEIDRWTSERLAALVPALASAAA